jgi:hypothetical protein
MKQYKPIATYSLVEDIISLFPSDRPKPDMGDIIYNQFKEGYGEPRLFDEPDPEAIWDEKEIMDDNANFILTKDRKHGVRFTRGTMYMGVPYGYYIDIYELIDEDTTEPEFTEAQLKLISRERRAIDSKIKQVIIKEFKEHFTEPGQGLDFFQYCPDSVYGMLDECGDIGRMLLDDEGNIKVELGGEYEDPVEEFESRYFACDDWPQLLINVRRGIKDGWTIEEDDYI